jgi:dTDP-4-dehydrorhamnose reductase
MAIQRIFLTGANGMLGSELSAYLSAKGYHVTGVGSAQFNLLHSINALREVIEVADPQLIIHAAAYTHVDKAEHEPELAMAINKDGTQKMALLAKELNCLFALISTDYVFNGQRHHPYKTTDKPSPLGVYGWSKYYAELLVSELLDDYYIIRTGWLYGLQGRNFVQFVLEALRQGRELSIIDDQVGGPYMGG